MRFFYIDRYPRPDSASSSSNERRRRFFINFSLTVRRQGKKADLAHGEITAMSKGRFNSCPLLVKLVINSFVLESCAVIDALH